MRWLWIDRIIEHEPRTRLVAIKEIPAEGAHLVERTDGVMRLPLLIEGMAQTAGILVGTMTGFKEKVILAKISRASLEKDVVAGDSVQFDATLDRIDDAGASTSGTLLRRRGEGGDWERVGEVDLMFSHVDQNMAGIDFPEENFVFGPTFRQVINDAGLGDLIEV